MTSAIAAPSGPAHGGAAGEAVTGFGHRVYRTEDPRARHMRDGVENL